MSQGKQGTTNAAPLIALENIQQSDLLTVIVKWTERLAAGNETNNYTLLCGDIQLNIRIGDDGVKNQLVFANVVVLKGLIRVDALVGRVPDLAFQNSKVMAVVRSSLSIFDGMQGNSSRFRAV